MQEQLLLFDVAPTSTRAIPGTGVAANARPIASTAIDPQPSTQAPLIFRHPRSRRELWLGEHLIAYELRRSRRRSIGFTVCTEGLSVTAPRWATLGNIDSALREKSAWIMRKLGEQQQHAQRLHLARVAWRDGVSIPFLGEEVSVVLGARATGAILQTNASLPASPRPSLHVGLPYTASAEQIRDVVQSWLKRQALRIFEDRCQHFAARLCVKVLRVSLSSAQTRWGSANANGSVRLNWRLIHFSMSTIDYVVAHELAHLRHMDHSPKFWDVVRSVVPDYERARGALNDDVLPGLE